MRAKILHLSYLFIQFFPLNKIYIPNLEKKRNILSGMHKNGITRHVNFAKGIIRGVMFYS